MWKRAAPEKQPTPATLPPEPVSQVPAPILPEGEEREEERSEVNMFDEFQHNIGELSVFNEKEDVSCLFHSFFH